MAKLPIPYTPPASTPLVPVSYPVPAPAPIYPTYLSPPVVVAQPVAAQDKQDAKDVVSLGMGVVKWLLGVAAVCLLVVSTLWMLGLALALSATFGEAFKLCLIAIAASLSLAGLPIAAALLSRNYPAESTTAMNAWFVVLCVAILGATYFTMALTDGSGQSMDTSIFPYGGEAVDNPARKVLVAILNVLALGGAGLLGRLYVLASAEAVRLPNGEASPGTRGGAAGALPEMGETQLTPLEIFSMWYNGRIKHETSGRLSANGAYEDYRAACSMNGYPSVTDKKFYDLLTSKAQNSGGRIGKIKSEGKMYYTGIAFAGDAAPIDISVDQASGYAGAPYRAE